VWDVGEIAPTPGILSIKVLLDFGSGQTIEVSRDVEVGVRSDDVIVVGWIDPNKVPLSDSGIDPCVAEYFPVGGLVASNNPVQQGLTAAYLEGLATGVNLGSPANPSRPLCLSGTGGAGGPLTTIEKSYILDWLFEYAANFVSPPSSFANDSEVRGLEGGPTRYKLFSRLQVKYTVETFLGGTTTFGSLTVLRHATHIGVTNEPVAGLERPGQAGPAEGTLERSADNRTIYAINDGSPEVPAVAVFNVLEYPLKWSNIGSRIEQGVGFGAGYGVFSQVYPTYYIYQNLQLVEVRDQAASPSQNFNNDPYPPGPAPFIP